ncbi:MAG: ATP-binding protein [Elusimicrobiota bacterium]
MLTKLKQLLYPNNTAPFHQLVNLWAIEDNCVIGVDGSVSVVYELSTLPDLIHFPPEETNGILQGISRSLLSLPNNTVLQFIVEGSFGNADIIKRYRDTVKVNDNFSKTIVKDKVDFLFNVKSRKYRYFLYVTIPKDKIPAGSFYFTGLKNKLADYHGRQAAKINSIAGNFTREVSSCGIKTRQLLNDELLSFLYQKLNPGRPLDFKPRPGETLRSQLCLSAAENSFYYTTLGDKYFKAVNLHSRPESISFFYVAQFLAGLDVDFTANFTLLVSPDEDIRKMLKSASTLDKQANFLTPSVRYKAIAIDSMLDDIEHTHQRLFGFTLSVMLSDSKIDFLTKKTNNAVSAFRTLGEAEGIIENMNHIYLLLSSLPGHSFFNSRVHPFAQDAIANLLPIQRSWQGSEIPKMVFLTGASEMIGLDLFDKELPAKHGLIIGSTGSGKSFTTNYFLTNYLIESSNNQVVIIDVGGSYRKLCEIFGGQYVDIKISDEYAFNPFPQKQFFYTESKEVDPDVFSFLGLILQKMLKRPELSGRESTIIENCIKSAYKNAKTDPPRLEDVSESFKNYEGDEEDKSTAVGFYKDLAPWVSGRYGTLLNNKNPKLVLNPNARIVVFDLQKLADEKDLGPVMFFVVRSAIQARLANKQLQKIIVIDEGWQFFNDDTGSQLIENLYRTARKFNASVFSISQSPADFLSTKASNAIISNSYTKYFLKIDSKGTELLPQFGLNHSEISEIQNLSFSPKKYSEVFVKFLNHCSVLRIIPNPLDYWICTTDSKDYIVEQEFKKKHPQLSYNDFILKLSKEVSL